MRPGPRKAQAWQKGLEAALATPTALAGVSVPLITEKAALTGVAMAAVPGAFQEMRMVQGPIPELSTNYRRTRDEFAETCQ